jgi:hypothetical protein
LFDERRKDKNEMRRMASRGRPARPLGDGYYSKFDSGQAEGMLGGVQPIVMQKSSLFTEIQDLPINQFNK